MRHRRRPESDRFYRRAAWRRLRRHFLSKHPLCADPFGYHEEDGTVVEATEVHHKVPRKESPTLELAANNLESLCKSCHSRLTRKEMSHAG